MDEFLSSWMGRNGYLPHGVCFTWSPGLLWSMVTADAMIAASYYSIPLALVQLARKRSDLSPFRPILFLFSAFIFACGTTHLLSIWTIWRPDYGLETLAKMATALVSLVTAVLLWRLIPQALRVPSVAQLEREAAQRRAAQAGLAESEESLEVALAGIGAGFISTDAAGRVTRINPLAQQLTGWPDGAALGRDLADVYARGADTDRAAPAGDLPALPALSVAFLLQCGDGPLRAQAVALRSRAGGSVPIEESASILRSGDGAVRGMAIVFRDLREMRRSQAQAQELAELRLREAQLQAENHLIQESNRLKSSFLANMSHELRTPLNAIIGFADLLHMGQVPPGAPQTQEFLGYIRTSGRHLLQLINDLLDLSKVEAGKFEFRPEPVDLQRIAGEVVTILHETAAAKSIRVSVRIDADVRRVVLDPARLRQVLYNYLSNALKFTAPGGRVGVAAHAEGLDRFRVEVSDTGPGIAPQDLASLFSEFQQLDPGYGRTGTGTGLGLALTKRLVEAQGGSVGVRSELQAGSCFYAILPRVAGPAPAVQAPPRDTGAARILVIEDDRRDQDFLAQSLRRAGFQVDVVGTGEQALALTCETVFAAITLDLVLPDLPGLAVLAALRAQGLNREVPVVVVSMATPELSVAVFSVGDVLIKPVSPQAVLAALHRAGLPAIDPARQPVPTILVVDDDAQACQMISAALRDCGYAVECLQDAAAALQQLDRIRPAAVILDLVMPGMDGLVFLDTMRRHPTWRTTPVFVWTGQDLDDAQYRHLAASAQAVVHKGRQPVAELVEDLRRWFGTAAAVPP